MDCCSGESDSQVVPSSFSKLCPTTYGFQVLCPANFPLIVSTSLPITILPHYSTKSALSKFIFPLSSSFSCFPDHFFSVSFAGLSSCNHSRKLVSSMIPSRSLPGPPGPQTSQMPHVQNQIFLMNSPFQVTVLYLGFLYQKLVRHMNDANHYP